MYFGPMGERANTVVAYMQRTFGTQCAPRANPAEYVLAQSRPIEGQPSPAERWNASPEARQTEEVQRQRVCV